MAKFKLTHLVRDFNLIFSVCRKRSGFFRPLFLCSEYEERIEPMLEVLGLSENTGDSVLFNNYDELFKFITHKENMKLLGNSPLDDAWSFTVYPSAWAACLLNDKSYFTDNNKAAIKHSYEQQLELLEICTGDYQAPLYIAVTENVRLDELKKKWCHEYCDFHDFPIQETFLGEEVTSNSREEILMLKSPIN